MSGKLLSPVKHRAAAHCPPRLGWRQALFRDFHAGPLRDSTATRWNGYVGSILRSGNHLLIFLEIKPGTPMAYHENNVPGNQAPAKGNAFLSSTSGILPR